MKYVGTAFVASTLLIVAWIMYTIKDMIPGFAVGAAELLSLVVRACLGTVIVVVAVVVIWWIRRQNHEHDRQRDGAFALREYYLEAWPRRILNTIMGKPSPKVILDANAMMTHAALIYQGIHAAEPPAGWDRQLNYLQDVERTRRVQAAIAGDAVLGNPLVSLERGLGGVANAATGRMLAGGYDKTIKPPTFVEPHPPLALPAPALTGDEAVEQSRPAQIVMGQANDGALVKWDMVQTPHLRFHGMTQGSGKTNAIQTVAAGALATGCHVVICDRVQFKDWTDFEGRAEFVDTADPAQLASAALRLYNIYLGRTVRLREVGARNVAQYSARRGEMQRIVVIVSEFGAQMASARADGIGRDVEYPLSQLARLAGSAGIHLVAEDQVVKGWPRELAGNMVPVIGRMPAYAGQACGYQGRGGGTDTFPSFTFWYEGALFRTPHMEPVLPSIMAELDAPRALVMLADPAPLPAEDGSSQPVHGAVHSQFTEQFMGSSPEVAPPPPTAMNTPMNTVPTTVEGWYEWTLDNYLPLHPELLQVDAQGRGIGVSALAAAMAAENGKTVDDMKGTASGVAKRLRSEAALPGGSRLGVDITNGGE